MKKPGSRLAIIFLLSVIFFSQSCSPDEKMENKVEKNKIYIVPLNEEYTNTKKSITIYLKNNYQSITSIKKYNLESRKESNNKKSNFNQDEEIAENYLLEKYGLIEQNKKIDITESLDFMYKKNLLRFIFNKSLVYDINKYEIIKNSKKNYYLIGPDFIRYIKEDIDDSRGNTGLKLFFEKYDAWPYMIIVNKDLYYQFKPRLIEEFNKPVEGGEEM